MTKSDLIERVARRNPDFVGKDVEVAVRTIIDEMCSSLTKGQRVEVRGFGAFVLNYRPPRIARNPKSGAVVKVPAKYVPHFKPGKELRERASAK